MDTKIYSATEGSQIYVYIFALRLHMKYQCLDFWDGIDNVSIFCITLKTNKLNNKKI